MLHIVNKSPFERNSLESCMKIVDDKSIILLIEDGVIGANQTSKSSLIEKQALEGRIFALKGDYNARGLNKTNLIKGVELIGYDSFVKLVVEHGTAVSWV